MSSGSAFFLQPTRATQCIPTEMENTKSLSLIWPVILMSPQICWMIPAFMNTSQCIVFEGLDNPDSLGIRGPVYTPYLIFYSISSCSLGGPPLRTLSNQRSGALIGWHLNRSLRLLASLGSVLLISWHRSLDYPAQREGLHTYLCSK